jgi:hypothetical protein
MTDAASAKGTIMFGINLADSRVDLPIALACLRAAGELGEFLLDDLRLTRDDMPPALHDFLVRSAVLQDLFRDALEDRLRKRFPAELPLLRQRTARVEADPLRRVGFLLRAADWDGAEAALRRLGDREPATLAFWAGDVERALDEAHGAEAHARTRRVGRDRREHHPAAHPRRRAARPCRGRRPTSGHGEGFRGFHVPPSRGGLATPAHARQASPGARLTLLACAPIPGPHGRCGHAGFVQESHTMTATSLPSAGAHPGQGTAR